MTPADDIGPRALALRALQERTRSATARALVYAVLDVAAALRELARARSRPLRGRGR